MPDPRYRPRDYFKVPELFGYDGDAELVEVGTARARAERQASLFQHHAMRSTRMVLAGTGWSRKRFAAELQMNYDRLSRLFSGSVVMRLDDLGAIVNVLPAIRDEFDWAWITFPGQKPPKSSHWSG